MAATFAGDAKLRVVVVGAGVFGRNHLRVWRELERGRVEVLAVAVHPGVFDVCAILARLSHTTSAARS